MKEKHPMAVSSSTHPHLPDIHVRSPEHHHQVLLMLLNVSC